MADYNVSGRSGLIKPGCLLAMAPALIALLVVGLGLLGGLSIGILMTIIAAGIAVSIIIWFVKRSDATDIRNEPPPPYNPGSDDKEGSTGPR